MTSFLHLYLFLCGSCYIDTACVSSIDLLKGILFLYRLQLHLSATLPFPEGDNTFLKYLNTDASLCHQCNTLAFVAEFALYHLTLSKAFLLKDRLALLKSPLCSLSVCWSHWCSVQPHPPHLTSFCM